MSRSRPGQRSQPREKGRLTVTQRARRRPVLVGQQPTRLKVGVKLTDGVDYYEIKDTHFRLGTLWCYLINMEHPELCAWFALSDMVELGYV